MTAEDLMADPVSNTRTELVAGHLLVHEPSGYQHGDVAARLLIAIGSHVHAHGLGRVLAAETGFTLSRAPDTVRAPDVAFIRWARVPTTALTGYPEFAPDLAVEVVSPSDRTDEVVSKTGDWLRAGARLVWIVNPRRRIAQVYRADGTDVLVTDADALDGEDVLPGLRIPLAAMID
jgi:Uma2 family endonuclease